MKLWNVLVSVILLCLISSSVGFSGNFEKETIMLMDSVTKKTSTYKITNTLLNGKELDTDVPGYLVEKNGKQTVYVPVSTIYRNLGASVSWKETQKTLTIKQGKNTYVLIVGKNYITVNNKKKSIENGNTVMLMKYANTDRTMVPVSLIGSAMGMEIKYQPEIRTVSISQPMGKIQGITYNAVAQYKEIRIKTNSEISTTNYMIDGTSFGGKSKIIVEFQNALVDQGVNTALTINDGEVSRVDLVNPLKVPPRVRVEVELNTQKGYYTYYDSASKEQVIQLVNTLKDVQFQTIGNYHVVNLKTGTTPITAIKTLHGKLVIDFLDTKLVYNNSSSGTKSIQNVGLVNVAYSQFDPKYEYKEGDLVSRVVLNFEDGLQQEKAFVKTTSEGIQVFIEGDPDKGISYIKETSSISELEFVFDKEVAVEKKLDQASKTLTLKIPKHSIILETIENEYNDNLVASIDVDALSDPENYIVTVKLLEGTTVYDNSYSKVTSVAFINEVIRSSENQKTLIVLDAGHGGSDPGAIGKFTGVKEKDLALKAVYALKAELELGGYEVALTRTGDTKVELLQRTDFANEINGDLFISIHYNAVDDTKVNGVEVLYYKEPTGQKKAFADLLFTEVVSASGAKARKVVERPLLVVTRETKMPSAIIEMGFITNQGEEIRIQNDDYLKVQVKAITRAVNKYLYK